MFEERKVNPKQRELYLEKGYWTNQTLLDCWEQTLSQYRTGNTWQMTGIPVYIQGNG